MLAPSTFRNWRSVACLLLALCGCLGLSACAGLEAATKILRPSAREGDVIRHPDALPAPVVLSSTSESLLRWVGLNVARTGSPMAVYGATCDGSKGSAVDLQAACLAALITISSRTPAIMKVSGALSNATYGPTSPGNPPMVPFEAYIQPTPQLQRTAVLLPDMELHGWATGQQTGNSDSIELGLAGTSAELAKSRSVAYQSTDFTFTLRRRATSVFEGRVVHVRALTWDASVGSEAGVYVSASFNGKSRGVGVRAQRAKTEAVNGVDLHRTVAAVAIAALIASHYGLDAEACECLKSPDERGANEGAALAELRVATSTALHKTTEEKRAEMAVQALQKLGYLASGKRTSAETRLALRGFRAERGMALIATSTAVSIDELMALKQTILEKGDLSTGDIAMPRRDGVLLTAENGVNDLLLHAELRVYAVVPGQGGNMTCAYRSDPKNEWLMISPSSATDPGDRITAQAAVAIPRDRGAGPDPRLTVDEVGTHRVWCVLSRVSLAKLLPKEMTSPPREFKMGAEEFPEMAKRLLGDAWISDGLIVVTAKQQQKPKATTKPTLARKPPAATGCRCEPDRGGVTCMSVPIGSLISSATCPAMLMYQQPPTTTVKKS